MVVKVLVVDDSGFFRRRVSEILSADPTIQVIGTATNGKEAIDQALALKPDVITMDYEMPMMDGITAVRHIMQRCPTPVLMFSSLTHEGARVTLEEKRISVWAAISSALIGGSGSTAGRPTSCGVLRWKIKNSTATSATTAALE
uniref:response regulator n=1 Tax=Pseudomonas bubulae TaxID=2316085 RepID=UPI00211A94A5